MISETSGASVARFGSRRRLTENELGPIQVAKIAGTKWMKMGC